MCVYVCTNMYTCALQVGGGRGASGKHTRTQKLHALQESSGSNAEKQALQQLELSRQECAVLQEQIAATVCALLRACMYCCVTSVVLWCGAVRCSAVRCVALRCVALCSHACVCARVRGLQLAHTHMSKRCRSIRLFDGAVPSPPSPTTTSDEVGPSPLDGAVPS